MKLSRGEPQSHWYLSDFSCLWRLKHQETTLLDGTPVFQEIKVCVCMCVSPLNNCTCLNLQRMRSLRVSLLFVLFGGLNVSQENCSDGIRPTEVWQVPKIQDRVSAISFINRFSLWLLEKLISLDFKPNGLQWSRGMGGFEPVQLWSDSPQKKTKQKNTSGIEICFSSYLRNTDCKHGTESWQLEDVSLSIC